MAADRRTPLLVLGLGNLLCRDDGLGVTAVHRLEDRYQLPPGVKVLDGGTLGLALLAELTGARQAILVDAVSAAAPPGAPVRLEGSELHHAVAERLSVHQIGVADLMLAADLLDRVPDRLVLVGLVPGEVELGLGCTADVEAALPELVDRIAAE